MRLLPDLIGAVLLLSILAATDHTYAAQAVEWPVSRPRSFDSGSALAQAALRPDQATRNCLSKSIGLRPDKTDGSRKAFSFPVVIDAAPGAVTQSRCIRFTDVHPIRLFRSARGGEFSINGGPFDAKPRAIQNNDDVTFRIAASAVADEIKDDYAVFDEVYLGGFTVRTKNEARPARTWQVGPERQYKQVSAITAMLAAGDTVMVDPGQYQPFELKRSGTQARPIRIIGVGPTRPVFSAGSFTVHLNGSHFAILENIEITGGNSVCLRLMAHYVAVIDSLIRDCPRNGILAADTNSGTILLDRVEVTRSGGLYRNEKFSHAIYVSSDRDGYPDAVFRMQNSKVHDFKGIGVKSRAARNEIYTNTVVSSSNPDSLYTLELIGFEEYVTDHPQDSDVDGNTLIHNGRFGIRLGGDGSGASKGRVVLSRNQFQFGQGFQERDPVVRLYHELDSAWFAQNQFQRGDGDSRPLVLFRDDIATEGRWISGAPLLGGAGNRLPRGSNLSPSRMSFTQWTAPNGSMPAEYEIKGAKLR